MISANTLYAIVIGLLGICVALFILLVPRNRKHAPPDLDGWFGCGYCRTCQILRPMDQAGRCRECGREMV